MRLLVVVCGIAVLGLTTAGFADSVTLNTGEVIRGHISSETEAAIQIEVGNEAQTIFRTRIIPRAEIKSVEADTAEFEALDKYKPDPNQEFPAETCDEGIAALESFLKAHPTSIHAPEARQRIAKLADEKEHVAKGEVKFANRWMTSDERERQARIAQAAASVGDLKRELANLQNEEKRVAGNVTGTEQSLQKQQTQLGSMPDMLTLPLLNGKSTTTPNPEKLQMQKSVAAGKQRLAGWTSALAETRHKIEDVVSQLQRAEDECNRVIAEVDQERDAQARANAPAPAQQDAQALAAPTTTVEAAVSPRRRLQFNRGTKDAGLGLPEGLCCLRSCIQDCGEKQRGGYDDDN
jgi:DNA repair exonuclease SbcCD ATPase subunit